MNPETRGLYMTFYYFCCSYLEASLSAYYYIDEAFLQNSEPYDEIASDSESWISAMEKTITWLMDELHTIASCEERLSSIDNEAIDDNFARNWSKLLHNKVLAECHSRNIRYQVSMYCAYCLFLRQTLLKFDDLAQDVTSSMPFDCQTYIPNRPKVRLLLDLITSELERVYSMSGQIVNGFRVDILGITDITLIASELVTTWQYMIKAAADEFNN